MTHDVNRWHSNKWPALRNSGDTIRSHSARVFALASRFFGPILPPDVCDYILTHDDHEVVTGDIPATAKTLWPKDLRIEFEVWEECVRREMGLPDCPDKWERKVTFCDRLDAYRWVAKHCPEALHDGGFPELREDLLRQAEGFGLWEVGL